MTLQALAKQNKLPFLEFPHLKLMGQMSQSLSY